MINIRTTEKSYSLFAINFADNEALEPMLACRLAAWAFTLEDFEFDAFVSQAFLVAAIVLAEFFFGKTGWDILTCAIHSVEAKNAIAMHNTLITFFMAV